MQEAGAAIAADLDAVKNLPYRKGVGIALFDARDRVFVAQRIDSPSPAWQLPQGGIDKGETPQAAAWREMKEEIGTDLAQLIGETSDWLDYDLPIDLVPRLWKGRYRGQRQKWFAFRFLGSDGDIDIEGEKPEFSAWRWAELGEIADLIVPFKRDMYRRLARELRAMLEIHPAVPARGHRRRLT